MATAAERPKADTRITMRLPKTTRELIDSAAAAQGKSRTAFMIECARLHAIDVLLDQRVFNLDPDQSAALIAALDNPPPPNAALRALMAAGAENGVTEILTSKI